MSETAVKLTKSPQSLARFTCDECGVGFQFKCRLTEHVNELHEKKLQYPCRMPNCGMVYAYRPSRNKHEKRVHPPSATNEPLVLNKFECKYGCVFANSSEVKWYPTKDLREQHHARIHSNREKTPASRKPAPRAVGWNSEWCKEGDKHCKKPDAFATRAAYAHDNTLESSVPHPHAFKPRTVKQLKGALAVAVTVPPDAPHPQFKELVEGCKSCPLDRGAKSLTELKSALGSKNPLLDTAALNLVRTHAGSASASELDAFIQDAAQLVANKKPAVHMMHFASAWRQSPSQAVAHLAHLAWESAPRAWEKPWDAGLPSFTPQQTALMSGTLERLSTAKSGAEILTLLAADAAISEVFTLAAYEKACKHFDPFVDEFQAAAPHLIAASQVERSELTPHFAPLLRAMSGLQVNARVPLMGWLSSPLRWVKLLLELRDVPSGKFRSGALDFIERDLRVLDLHPDQQARVLLLARCVRDRADCDKVLSGLCVSKAKFEDFPS